MTRYLFSIFDPTSEKKVFPKLNKNSHRITIDRNKNRINSIKKYYNSNPTNKQLTQRHKNNFKERKRKPRKLLHPNLTVPHNINKQFPRIVSIHLHQNFLLIIWPNVTLKPYTLLGSAWNTWHTFINYLVIITDRDTLFLSINHTWIHLSNNSF